MRKILLLLVVMALTLVPGVTAFEYFIEYGPYSTDDYGDPRYPWYGTVYDANPQYPLTDYEIDVDVDFSSNTNYKMMGEVLITGYSGENESWQFSVLDGQCTLARLDIRCSVAGSELGSFHGHVPADWSGRLKFVHSSPDNWELWADGNLLGDLTKPDIGPLTNITVGLSRYDAPYYIPPPGMSCDRILISGNADIPPPPTPPPTHIRTGAVTMTDHNGTPISGFEVRAVNYYTSESHTVSTDTDVAVISLPMDRTTEIRNPQTGVYEEAPVGYYTFYGQAPGYKMLHEDGIRVRVMPEKYGSYKLCDILVTSESGPLSGKHQFQIRSRADNSVLQSGTISAQSRTTGEWYNTTVTNGIATLILPYDTSDALSEHAGHYYVYATSPGYEDSDYGTQIAVYPHTVSEVKTILLTPIGGVPTPGNVTLRIDVFSEGGSGVPNAQIFIAGVLGAGKDVWDTYTASSSGYLEVSVPGNSTYDIVASGAGYYDSSRRIEVLMDDPPLIEIKLYLSGAPTVEPTTEPTGWPTGPPTTQPTGGIPDEDDDSDGFMVQAVRSIANLFGVSFGIGKTILGMLIALAIGTATAKQLKGGAQEFGMGMLGGVVLGVLIGLLPIWVLVLLLLIIGLWIGYRYMSGGDS